MTTLAYETRDEQTNGGDRDRRDLLPLWRIKGAICLKTPLSIGSGRDEPIRIIEQDGKEKERYVVAVMRDTENNPYIPASSFKGALNALARKSNMDSEVRACLFGFRKDKTTRPGRVEYCNLMSVCIPDRTDLPNWDNHTANLPHVALNRDYRTAEDKKLFLEQVVPPDAEFAFECTARAVDESAIEALLGLLDLAGKDDSPLRLGGGKTTDNGQISWKLEEVRRLDDLAALWKVLAEGNAPASNTDLWSDRYSQNQTGTIKPATLQASGADWLTLNKLELNFHTPFLVYQRQPRQANQNASDGAPRHNHHGCPVLPASSLHGALRSQAERILRTVGIETKKGYEVPAVRNVSEAGKTLDLASVLFGAPGWRSVVRLGDFVAPKSARTMTHEMVAIDRLTGGGKDTSKFNIQVLDCPTLTGNLSLDLRRLRLLEEDNPDVVAQALGLLAHVLRDLDEGDISLGYGAAKGYGRSRSDTCNALRNAIDNSKSQGIENLGQSLQAFAAKAVEPEESAKLKQNETREPAAPNLTEGNGDFHNPYVFIPFDKAKPDDEHLPWVEYGSISDGDTSPHSHARYAPNTFNGRLVCRLTTRTPIFVGAGDAEDTEDPKQKENFKLDNEIALPATSLRGMLSSLHESITQSRLRVMEDGRYSVRAQTNNALSAVGRVLIIGGKYWLQMVALPTLELNGNTATIPAGYRSLLPDVCRNRNAPLKSLIADRNNPLPGNYQSYSFSDSTRWYMEDRTNSIIHIEPGNIWLELECEDGFHIKQAGRRRFLLGKRRDAGEYPKARGEVESMRWASAERGVVRIMGAQKRDMVATRKHEMFLPLSGTQERVTTAIAESLGKGRPAEVTAEDIGGMDLTGDYQLLPIPQEVVDRFERLADEMTKTQENDDSLSVDCIRPYHPIGTMRNRKEIGKTYFNIKPNYQDRVLRLKHCDLVFFCPDANGQSIEEIAYSSIWRQEIDSDISSFVGDELSPLVRPHNQNKLSPSELLFGCVEIDRTDQRNQNDAHEQQTRAFASKVQFGFGRWVNEPVVSRDWVFLKILSSPKPPSPAMYFKNQNGSAEYISKAQLAASPAKFKLKGRKAYLHALRRNGEIQAMDNYGVKNGSRMPWETGHPSENIKQKVRVKPIDKGAQFYFEVDFVNLSQAELESLCACLVPHSTYEHKLGMGKPIGLGSVKIEIVGMYLVDRQVRYRQQDFGSAPRYSMVCKLGDDCLPAHLKREQDVPETEGGGDPVELANVQMTKLKGTAPDVFNAIVLTGNPEAVHKPVHYPQLAGQDVEGETFAWFDNNDKPSSVWDGKPQYLTSFSSTTEGLPVLSRIARKKKQKNKRPENKKT